MSKVGAASLDQLWDEVIGQPAAVAQLHAATTQPVHAYLLVGPEGSGRRAAARAFSASLLTDRLDAPAEVERGIHLAAIEAHPSMMVVERDGPAIDAEQARAVARRAGLAPPEGDRQVIVLVDFHLVREAAPILLKSVEEPAAQTVFVVLAEEVTPELVTIASRCVVIEFSAVPRAAIVDRLVGDGVDVATAEAAADGAGGSLSRARLLAHDPDAAGRRELWYRAPERLDGTGSAACAVADELTASIDGVLAPLAERQAAEVAEFEERSEMIGGARRGDAKRLESRHNREQRRARLDEFRSGLATLVARYRDEVQAGGSAEAFLEAADAVQVLCDGLPHNPRESLALEALLMGLPRLR